MLATEGTVATAIAALQRSKPDILLLDYELPDGHGTEICRQARIDLPDCHAVMLTQFDKVSILIESIDAGASACLPKTSSLADVANAVRAAHEGESLLPASALQSLLGELRRDPIPADPATRDLDLTPREREVLQLIAEGHTNSSIAERLVISPHTVRTHVQHVLQKLGVHSKLAAAAAALRLGLLPPTDPQS